LSSDNTVTGLTRLFHSQNAPKGHNNLCSDSCGERVWKLSEIYDSSEWP